jgi:hypothetical protein
MGDITIYFNGICTQVSAIPADFGVAARHRVVLVHAEDGRVIGGKPIPPHIPTLTIPFDQVVDPPYDFASMARGDGSLVWQLDGTRLRIGNPAPGDVAYLNTYWQVPRLREHNPDLSPLKREVVAGTNAAAHFDVNAGNFTSEMIHHGAWRSVLNVETDGDDAQLVITPIGGGTDQTIRIRSGAAITVANTGNKKLKESEYDFFLHYLVLDSIPPRPFYPPPAGTGDDMLGPGCSNSNYP